VEIDIFIDPLVGKIFKVQRLNILRVFRYLFKSRRRCAGDFKNACGELVRPGVIQAQIVEARITRLQVV
jgi:hypothetical protein